MKPGWKRLPFGDVFADESGGNVKTPQAEFLVNGRYPIVDQGKAPIAGYSDDESRLCRSKQPVIVFGDHTRCVKYVNFPFCMGADGVKVLRPKVEADTKYLYHFLRQLRLTDGGYDRHFKYLRRCEIVVPPLSEQRQLADILDRAEALRAKRRAALALLNALPQAIFLDLFGDPATNPKGWNMATVGDCAAVQGGLQVSAARSLHARDVPYLRVANVHRCSLDLTEVKRIRVTDAEATRAALVQNDLLIVEGHGNPDEIGRSALWDNSIPGCVHQNHLIRARFDSGRVNPIYALEYLNSPVGRRHLLRAGKTTSGLNTINVTDVRSTPLTLPPLTLQHEFARRVAAVEQLRSAQRRSLAKLDELYGSLQHRAFRGEL